MDWSKAECTVRGVSPIMVVETVDGVIEIIQQDVQTGEDHMISVPREYAEAIANEIYQLCKCKGEDPDE